MKRCKYCVNRITDNSGASYCKMQKSSRTYNGLKPVKASSMACVMYKRKDMTKEETMEEKLCIGLFPVSNGRKEIIPCDGYEVVVENGKTYVVKKKPTYPKDYKECCEVLGILEDRGFGFINLSECENTLMSHFIQLKRCRDAYWKIAGEQLGLDKPWKPDWEDEYETYYTISYDGVNIKCYNDTDVYSKLAFPTMEMRDAFFENFKELIEQCKELL